MPEFPHPEGGHYAEVHRSAASTSIYFLLAAGEVSRWHRVRSEEIWHFYEGSPLELLQLTPQGDSSASCWDRSATASGRSTVCPRSIGRRPLARRVHARRLHCRAGVPVRRFCAAQGFSGAGGVDRPKPSGCRPVRVAYDYEITTLAPASARHHRSSAAPVQAQQVTKETRDGIKNFSRLETTVACAGAIPPTRCPRSRRWDLCR